MSQTRARTRPIDSFLHLQRSVGNRALHHQMWGGTAGATPAPGAQIPTNTVTCLKRWQPCREPRSPGTWGARVTYHCPRLTPIGILPGTTMPAFVTIPDEYVGTDAGGDRYSCRAKPRLNVLLIAGDILAAALTRTQLYPGQAPCHAGFRANLTTVLNQVLAPSGGGRPAGVRVNQAPPVFGGVPFPCP